MSISSQLSAGIRYIHHSRSHQKHLLNWSDRDDLLSSNYLDPVETRLLEFLDYKFTHYSHRFLDPAYQHDLPLFIMSELLCRGPLAYCGLVNESNPSGLCSKHKYCPYCAYRQQKKIVGQFGTAFGLYGHNLFWVTCSYKAMDDCGHLFDNASLWMTEDLLSCPDMALKAAWGSSHIHGAILSREVAITQLLPLRALAHVHAVVHSIEEADVIQTLLQDGISEARSAQHSISGVNLKPDVKVEQITSEGDFVKILKYMVKIFTLGEAYQKALVGTTTSERYDLNREADDAITGYSYVTERRQKLTAFGSLHPRTFTGHRRSPCRSSNI